MRRYRKSYLRSFANGLMLAGLPVAAFLGADWLLAPPASETVAAISAPAEPEARPGFGAPPGMAREVSSQAALPAPAAVPPGVAQSPMRPAGSPAGSAKGGLIAAIQQELQRVGCYAGSIDGNWNDGTRVAMQAFNTSVHVSLPTSHPDYILLTLLQGHSSKACTRSCDADGVRQGTCIDRSIEARNIAPTAPATSRATAAAANQGSWTSTVVLSAPGKVTEMLAPGTSAAPRPAATSPGVETRLASPVPTTAAPSVQDAQADADGQAPIPGRMAVGLLPPPTRETGVAPAVVRPPRAEGGRPQRTRASGSGGRSMFSDISRNAP